MGARQDGRTILAWQIAALSRQKRLPKLDTLLGKRKSMDELKQTLVGFKGKGR